MSDIAEYVAAEQCFDLEFEDKGTSRFMCLRFCKGQDLYQVVVCRSGLPSTDLTGELGSLSRLFSAVSIKADIVACSGCSSDLVRTIDEMSCFTRPVQSCFRFDHLALPRMMHKSSYSVFGQIDLFSVLRGLMVSLGGSLAKDWMQRSPNLPQVSYH